MMLAGRTQIELPDAADPVCTAKALQVLRAPGERQAVFWHTGGLLDVITAVSREQR
jgi:hypothetical protein